MSKFYGGYWSPHIHINTTNPLSAEWEKEKSYEKNVAVTYGGDTYISRKDVPKNIEITNGDFWCLMSGYNAQIETYKKEIVSLSNAINECKTDAMKNVFISLAERLLNIDNRIEKINFSNEI